MGPYLTVGEVAVLLGKCEKWVYSNKEEIPGFFRLAKSIFFDQEVLFSDLKSRASKPAARKSASPSSEDRHGLIS